MNRWSATTHGLHALRCLMPKAWSPPRIFLFGLKACLVQQGQLLQLQSSRRRRACQTACTGIALALWFDGSSDGAIESRCTPPLMCVMCDVASNERCIHTQMLAYRVRANCCFYNVDVTE